MEEATGKATETFRIDERRKVKGLVSKRSEVSQHEVLDVTYGEIKLILIELECH